MNRLCDTSKDMLVGKLKSANHFASNGLPDLADKYLDEASGMIELALYESLISAEVHAAHWAQILEAREFIKSEKQRAKGVSV